MADLRLVWVIGQVASKLLRLEWAHNGHWVKQGGGWKGRENKRGKVEPFDMTQTKTAQRETVLRKNFKGVITEEFCPRERGRLVPMPRSITEQVTQRASDRSA